MKRNLPFLLLLILLLDQWSCSRTININDQKINHIQVIGSHNSYKMSIDPKLFKFLSSKDSAAVSTIDYSHPPLKQQLDMGLLNLEIDIYVDTLGGRYAHPKGLIWVKGQAPYDPKGEMMAPGFKVLHVPDIDFRSNFLTLKKGLQQLKEWSAAHPDHNPVFITVEPKDDKPMIAGLTPPEMFTQQAFTELDNDFLKYLGKENIITPDDIRGNFMTLEDAVLHEHWPTLNQAKGKFLFMLDARDQKMALYKTGHPSLKGRILFINADADTPEAAMMILNDPKDPSIPKLVKKGYIIRTRADSNTEQARHNDYSGFEAAKSSGAQIITTDYYQKSTHFKSDYMVSFGDSSKYFRLNPLFVSGH
jgi:hypothetical protein